MQGTVKFYSKEKGYGFIFSSESEKDLFFGISDWKNPTVPEGGDDIEFDIKETKKGKQAINIKLIKAQAVKKQEHFVKNDDRISCPSCGKKIVPRTITYKGRPQKTVWLSKYYLVQ
ncbi:'Cold-shock' DNA-binding domain protein [Francisella philomiragia]|nr:cold shock domain-containing protein [Francisella philomiragia]AJI54448.1 'Cold-shock' DNA-binding domain protein [Francisella philomiragia]MBK2252927.1 cold shock domain-containing protein [Francisella philomiragia]